MDATQAPAGPPTLRRQAVRGLLWTGASYATRFAVQIAILAVLARLLTPSDFGLVAMVAIVVNLLALLQGAGIREALTAQRAPSQLQLSSAYWYTVASTLAVALVVALLAPVGAWFYGEPDVIPVFLLSAAAMVVSSLSAVHGGLMARAMRFRPLAVRDVLSQLMAGAVAVSLAWQGYGFYALAVQGVVAGAFQTVFVWLASRWRPSLAFDWASFRDLLSFGSHVTGYQVLQYGFRNLDQFLLGALIGPASLAFYAQASQVLRLPATAFHQVASQVMVPALSRLDDARMVGGSFLESVRLACGLSYFPIAVLFVGAREGVLLLYGPQWLRSAFLLQVFAFLMLLHMATVGTGWIFRARRVPALQTRLMLVAQPVILAGTLIGLRWGPEGVAIGVTVAAAVLLPLMHYPLRLVQLGLADFLRALSGIVAAAVAAGLAMGALRWLLVTRFADLPAAAILATLVAVGLPVYLAVLRLLDVRLWQEGRRLLADVRPGSARRAAAAAKPPEVTP